MPGDSGVLVVTRVRSTNTSAHEAAGATGTRHSPRPLMGETTMHNSGASRGEIAKACLELEQTPSFRGDAKHRTRNLEIPRCAIAHLRSGPADHPGMTALQRIVCGCFEIEVMRSSTSPHETHPSWPDLIRTSTHLHNMLFSKEMDHRVKPGDDDFNWSEDHCEERLVRRSSTSEGGSDFARASSGLRLRTETPGVLRSGFPSPALPATKSPVRRRPAPSPAGDPRPMFPV